MKRKRQFFSGIDELHKYNDQVSITFGKQKKRQVALMKNVNEINLILLVLTLF